MRVLASSEGDSSVESSGNRVPSAWAVVFVGGLLVAATTMSATAASPQAASSLRPEPTRLDSCTTITEPGRYVLADDIDDSTEKTCLEVRADDVTIDGRDHVLDGAGSDGTDGIAVRRATNVTVRNISVTAWETGILLANTTDGTVRSVVVADNDRSGVHLENATDATLTNVTAVENVDPEARPFPGPSKSAGVFVVGSTATRIVDVNVSRNVGGVSLVDSEATVVSDSVAASNEVGFFVRGANDAVRNSVAAGNTVGFFADNASNGSFANVSAVSNRVGVGVENTTDATVTDANASSNFLGVSVVLSSGVSLVRTNAGGNFVGINFLDSRRNSLSESRVEANDFIGIGLLDVANTRISDTEVVATAGSTSVPGATSAGLYLNDSAVRFQNLTAVENDNWTVFSEGDSKLDATNVSVDGTRLSFGGTNVALDSTRTPSVPTDRVTVGRSVVVAGTAAEAELDLEIAYAPRAVSSANVDERTLRLWRYDGGWSHVRESRVLPDRDVVSGRLENPDRIVVTVLGEPSRETSEETNGDSSGRTNDGRLSQVP
ncbi:right-handed parallel beta-helix repeat-containing protein [Haladaptatus sp. NG-WS-4]